MAESSKDLVAILAPADVIAGLGAADRSMLSSCMALLDGNSLITRLDRIVVTTEAQLDRWRNKIRDDDAQQIIDRQKVWELSHWSDDSLRVALHIRLRTALGLPPRISGTLRGCQGLADDLTARLIHVLDPPSLVKTGKGWLRDKGWLADGEPATTLADVVMPVLDEVMADALKDNVQQPDPFRRRAMLRDAIINMALLSEAEQKALRDSARPDSINDAALRNMLLVGGGLAAFGASVSAAGFSAYILAAQASAFIPMVSGPGLVSFVSVLSNPITVTLVTAGAIWWLSRSAKQRVNAAVAARLVAMLTIRGVQSGRGEIESLLRSFREVTEVSAALGISKEDATAYLNERTLLGPTLTAQSVLVPSAKMKLLVQAHVTIPAVGGVSQSGGARKASTAGYEGNNAAAMAALTLGDVLYSAAAVNPAVLSAADFSSVAEIDGRVAFAKVAQEILENPSASIAGHISHLKGYVAEQAVAAELTAAGHTVSFPEAANEPGWDLLVDGQAFQVKFHATTEGIRDHFERYDFPVIANSELQGKVPDQWEDQVFFIDGLSTDLVEQITAESLEAGADMLEPNVIHAAGTISLARGLIAYRSGQLSGKQALEQVLLDGGVRVSLAGSGGVAGAMLGGLIFGPAGAWVFGAGAPVLAQMQTSRVTELMRKHVKGKEYARWEAEAHSALSALQRSAITNLKKRREQIAVKMLQAPDNDAGHWLRWRLADDGRFAGECERRLIAVTPAEYPIPEQRLATLLRHVSTSGIHPVAYQAQLRAVNRVLPQRPGVADVITELRENYYVRNTSKQLERISDEAREQLARVGLEDRFDGLIQQGQGLWSKATAIGGTLIETGGKKLRPK